MKKIALGLATCGLILSSCSSNDVFEDNQGTNNPNVINFSATTTRATVNTLNEVKGGFPVYANFNSTWHINGQTYSFDDAAKSWKWSDTAPQWPAVDGTNKIHFYAYYPADNTAANNPDGFTLNATTVGTLTGAFTINPTAATQIDFLAANTPDQVRVPQGGSVPLAFKHITTKINFGVNAAEGTKVYVQQMNINNVKNKGTYDYVLVVPSTEQVENKPWSYASNLTADADYDYFGTTTASESLMKLVKPFTAKTPEAAESFYGASHGNHLMLLPQAATPVWTPVKYSGGVVDGGDNQTNKPETTPAGLTIIPLKAYIGSVYRMTSTDGKDLVGYELAASHPNYETSNYMDPGIAGNSTKYNGPLFVKVGFPLTAKKDGTYPDLAWIMGKAYTYNMMLGQNGSSGGYILDNRYYDKYGNPTDLTINGKDPGEPVSKGTINFDVTVGEWEDGQGGTNPDGSGSPIN